jgi:hypothetical protein
MEQYQDIFRKLEIIEAALIGNPISKDGGLVGEVKDLKKEVAELKSFKDRSKWTATLLIGFAGMLGWLSDKLLDFFTKH